MRDSPPQTFGGGVLEAGLWAGLGQSALIVGALLVARFRKLTEPLGYYTLTEWLNRRAEREDPEEPVEKAAETGLDEQPVAADARAARNLTVGMVLDGIPESVAIGLTLLGGGSVSVALVGAVFLSNLPEAIGVAAALLAGHIPLPRVLARFAAIVAVGAIAGAVGYGVLNETDADAIAIIQSIAAGAMIMVIVNEMVPIAVRGAQRRAGLAAAAGFAVAAFLATLNA